MGFARFNRFDRLARFRVGYDLSTLASLQALQALFLPDDIAALFDYYNTAQLYEDAAATTPAAVGSPVGALLDVSRGLELRPELRGTGTLQSVGSPTPATFDTATGNGSAFRGVSPADQSWVRFTVELTKSYRITGFNSGPNTLVFREGNQGGVIKSPIISAGAAFDFVHSSAASAALIANTNVSGSVAWTGLSIRELKGNHAIWPTTAQKPTLRQTPETGRYWLEAIDADRKLEITFATAPGTMYVGRVTAEGIEWTTETWGTTVNVLRTNRYNAGIVARSRDWTVAEKALIAAYFARQMPTAGPELVVNGTFDADVSGWTPTAVSELTWNNGRLRATLSGAGSNTGATQVVVAPAGPILFKGTPYTVDASSPLAMRLSGGVVANFTSANSGVERIAVIISTGAAINVRPGNNSTNTTGSSEYDNISVRRVL